MDTSQVLSEVEHEFKQEGESDNVVVLSNGVRLRAQPVPPLLFQQVASRFKFPEPPTVYIEEKARSEPNPNDPAYLAECQRIEEAQRVAMLDAAIMMGIQVIYVPETVIAPESDEWIEAVEYLTGERVPPDSQRVRVLMWLKYYAAQTADDLIHIEKAVISQLGVPQEAVAEAIRSFRR